MAVFVGGLGILFEIGCCVSVRGARKAVAGLAGMEEKRTAWKRIAKVRISVVVMPVSSD